MISRGNVSNMRVNILLPRPKVYSLKDTVQMITRYMEAKMVAQFVEEA